MTVGQNIRKFRKEKKLTQKKLGELCGINEVQIRQYELEKANPKLETLNKIAAALNVEIGFLLDYEPYFKSPELSQLSRELNGEEGIIAILTDMYGKVECKNINEEYFSVYYYVFGEEKQFILTIEDIKNLYDFVKASLPFLVAKMMDKRPEEEIVKQLSEKLNKEYWNQKKSGKKLYGDTNK